MLTLQQRLQQHTLLLPMKAERSLLSQVHASCPLLYPLERTALLILAAEAL
jgi:hypothetical protein